MTVALIEDIAATVLDAPDTIEPLRKALSAEQEAWSYIGKQMATLPPPEELLKALDTTTPIPISGESVLIDALSDIVEDLERSRAWFGMVEILPLVDSLNELERTVDMATALERAREDDELSEAIARSVEGPVLRGLTEVMLSDNDLHQRLRNVNALAFIIGFARLAELTEALLHGAPPTTRFSGAERKVWKRLLERDLRRTARLWGFIDELREDATFRNDRAEKLSDLWMLHPVPRETQAYFGMLYRSYVVGHDQEAVIVCRAILERLLTKACERLGGSIPESMPKQILHLERHGVLSRHARESALLVHARGNKVVHGSPDFGSQSLEVIEALMNVVDDLVHVAN